MKVYVVEAGCYEDKQVAGVYSSPEAAMAAHPVNSTGAPRVVIPGGWYRVPDKDAEAPARWSNGLDFSDGAAITEYEVDAQPGPDAPVARAGHALVPGRPDSWSPEWGRKPTPPS